ncbi:hypothetical protein ABVN80_08825 [Acinetobacter baumannii]
MVKKQQSFQFQKVVMFTYMWQKGRIDVNGKTFNTGDAARIRDGGKLSFTNGDNAEILIFDMRPEEIPTMP